MVWVDSFEQVSFDPDCSHGHILGDGGVIMTLGGIDQQKRGEAVVRAGLYVNYRNGIQMESVLQKGRGAWRAFCRRGSSMTTGWGRSSRTAYTPC